MVTGNRSPLCLFYSAPSASPLAWSEAVELWSSYARRQFETLTDQSKELTALGQKIATSSAEPITRSFGQALKGAS